jgi:hypothetical protein
MILWSDYRRSLDWYLDLLNTYTIHDYTYQITVTQTSVLSHGLHGAAW